MNRAELIANCRRLVVKVGSAVLTGAQGLDRRRVGLLAAQVARLATPERQVLLVSSGAVATGRGKMGLLGAKLTIPQKQAVAALGQAGLMQAYEEAFAQHDRLAAQVLLTANDLRHRTRYENARNTLFTLLGWGVIPVVNENDTVAVAEIKLGDNDNLAAMLTNLLGAQGLIILTNVDGVLDADPRENPQARRIPLVERVEAELLKSVSDQPGSVGMGGVVSKVRSADKAARGGAWTMVANGMKDDVLDALSAGADLGTLFLPRQSRLTSRKHWIAFAAQQEGELVVDEGAVRPLVEMGKSLLAAGVRGVRGDFEAGSAVRVLGPGDCILGVGLCNYSSAEMERIKGLHTDQIAARLGRKESDEVIHRDNLVVFDLAEEEEVACLLNS